MWGGQEGRKERNHSICKTKRTHCPFGAQKKRHFALRQPVWYVGLPVSGNGRAELKAVAVISHSGKEGKEEVGAAEESDVALSPH